MRAHFLLFLLGLSLFCDAQNPEVIVNQALQEAVTADDIKSIFIGEQSFWPNGDPLCVVLPRSQTDSFEQTAQWALESDGFEYQKHWLSLVFQGRSNAPVFVKNEREIIEYVQDHPGCIGLLHSISGPIELQLPLL